MIQSSIPWIGACAAVLTSLSYIPQVRKAWPRGSTTDLSLKMMASGVKIMGELTKPCLVNRIDRESFRMTLTQGLNRQIRRMCSALGYKARRLQRVRIMNIHLGALRPGDWRHLTPAELAGLLDRPQRRRSEAI